MDRHTESFTFYQAIRVFFLSLFRFTTDVESDKKFWEFGNFCDRFYLHDSGVKQTQIIEFLYLFLQLLEPSSTVGTA